MATQLDYESILESISGGFFALDNEYRITYWNTAAEIGTGLPASEIVGKHVFEVFPERRGSRYWGRSTGSRWRPGPSRAAKRIQRRAVRGLVRRQNLSGGLRTVGVLPGHHGEKNEERRQKEMLVEISQGDQQRRKHLDELCVRAAEKIALLFEIPARNSSAIYLFDPRGNEIRLVAPALHRGGVLRRSRPPGGHPRCRPPGRAGRGGPARPSGARDDLGTARSAPLFPEEIARLELKTLIVMPLLVQDEVQGVIEVLSIKEKEFTGEELEILSVVANDLASGMSRKRLIDELRTKNIELESQTQKTLEASETLKKFLATFSHELRSPLNSIIGFSELLTKQFNELPPETVTEFMKNINTSGRHLQQIINDILDLSKIESGTMELHIASYPVSLFRGASARALGRHRAKEHPPGFRFHA